MPNPKHYYTEHEPTGDRLGVGCADCTTDPAFRTSEQAEAEVDAAQQEARATFLSQMREFLRAGSELVRVWDDSDCLGGPWNADEEFGQPLIDAEGLPEHGQPLFPLSFDEWLTEMYAHYFKDGTEAEGGAN